MGLKQRIVNFGTRFRRDQSGTLAALWAVSMSATVFAVGSAYDYAKFSTARSMSQDAADMLALTASSYMRDNNQVQPGDNDQGFVHATKYYLEDYGIHLDPYFDLGTREDGRLIRGQRPHFRVYYDTPSAGEVKVRIWGKTKPAFMSLAGVDIMSFNAESVVAYEALDIKDPASVVLVLDVSGSMDITDGDGVTRLDELESTVKEFMVKLNAIIPQDEDGNAENVLRTGIIPYYDAVDYSIDVPMDWGLVTNEEIDDLWAGGGTDASAGMQVAKTWLLDENAAHNGSDAATPTTDPLKFVILMTDGENNDPSNDAATVNLCNSIKNDQNAIIYTVGFSVSTTRATNMLTSCASEAYHFYKASDSDALTAVFKKIGKDIVEETIRIKT